MHEIYSSEGAKHKTRAHVLDTLAEVLIVIEVLGKSQLNILHYKSLN